MGLIGGKNDKGTRANTQIVCLRAPEVLRIGVFFDGSGNDTSKLEKYSNVYKLYLAYINDIDKKSAKFDPDYAHCEKPSTAIYKRGVGTDKDTLKDDPLGNAMALGMKDRIAGMFYDLREVIYIFYRSYANLPKVIELDVFGFSRGAATARHFINLIEQRHFTLVPEKFSYKSMAEVRLAGIHANNITYQINFVGIFDSVGSIGISGNNIEPSYSLDLSAIRVKDKVLHLIAEDEYRANFDLTSALQQSTIDYPPASATEGKIEEVLCPGVHSDIGGGYSAGEMEHGLKSDQLARIYLHKMYQTGLEYGVPFWPEGELVKKAEDLIGVWNISSQLQQQYDTLMDYYQRYSGLRLAYKRYRQLALTLEAHDKIVAEKLKVSGLAMLAAFFDTTMVPVNRRVLTHALKEAERYIRQLVGTEARAFLSHANSFYQRYVHKSVFPWNTTTGMWPQYKRYQSVDADTGQLVNTGFFHRQIFRSAYTVFAAGNTSIREAKWVASIPALFCAGFAGGVAVHTIAELVDYDKVVPKKFKDGNHGQ